MGIVLAQEHDAGHCTVIYVSKCLDPLVQGMPTSLNSIAASALLISYAERIVISHSFTLYALHQVVTILSNIQTQHMMHSGIQIMQPSSMPHRISLSKLVGA